MQSYLQKKKAEKTEEQAPNPVSIITDVSSASGKFKLTSWSRKPPKRTKKGQETAVQDLKQAMTKQHTLSLPFDLGSSQVSLNTADYGRNGSKF
jgi:hypothetical protein